MRDKETRKRFMYSVRQACPGETVLPHSRAVGPQAQADGDPFTTMEEREQGPPAALPRGESAADRCYSIDSRGDRYYFHINLKHPVVVRGVNY